MSQTRILKIPSRRDLAAQLQTVQGDLAEAEQDLAAAGEHALAISDIVYSDAAWPDEPPKGAPPPEWIREAIEEIVGGIYKPPIPADRGDVVEQLIARLWDATPAPDPFDELRGELMEAIADFRDEARRCTVQTLGPLAEGEMFDQLYQGISRGLADHLARRLSQKGDPEEGPEAVDNGEPEEEL
jgi:hypothetical protein